MLRSVGTGTTIVVGDFHAESMARVGNPASYTTQTEYTQLRALISGDQTEQRTHRPAAPVYRLDTVVLPLPYPDSAILQRHQSRKINSERSHHLL